MCAHAYITYVCARTRARMTERVCALIGQKIAENISQNMAKIAEKSFFKLVENPFIPTIMRCFLVAVFVSFFYCEKRQKTTLKKVLTSQFIEFNIGHIEKQQTKKPAITPVKKFVFVGKYTRRYENDSNIRIHGSDSVATLQR